MYVYWSRFEWNKFQTAEHGGTHVDAPAHFAKGTRRLDQIPMSNLLGPGVLINITVGHTIIIILLCCCIFFLDFSLSSWSYREQIQQNMDEMQGKLLVKKERYAVFVGLLIIRCYHTENIIYFLIYLGKVQIYTLRTKRTFDISLYFRFSVIQSMF